MPIGRPCGTPGKEARLILRAFRVAVREEQTLGRQVPQALWDAALHVVGQQIQAGPTPLDRMRGASAVPLFVAREQHDRQLDQMDRRLDLQERALELKSAQSQEGQYDIDQVVAEADAAHEQYTQPPAPEPPPGA